MLYTCAWPGMNRSKVLVCTSLQSAQFLKLFLNKAKAFFPILPFVGNTNNHPFCYLMTFSHVCRELSRLPSLIFFSFYYHLCPRCNMPVQVNFSKSLMKHMLSLSLVIWVLTKPSFFLFLLPKRAPVIVFPFTSLPSSYKGSTAASYITGHLKNKHKNPNKKKLVPDDEQIKAGKSMSLSSGNYDIYHHKKAGMMWALPGKNKSLISNCVC